MKFPCAAIDARDNPWIELPGLFEESELVADEALEVRACPLLLRGGRVFYGVYVRERECAARSAPENDVAPTAA
jgi:hypothetical protein